MLLLIAFLESLVVWWCQLEAVGSRQFCGVHGQMQCLEGVNTKLLCLCRSAVDVQMLHLSGREPLALLGCCVVEPADVELCTSANFFHLQL